MKKLVFLFAMIFAVSMAMGQTAVIDQSSSSPNASVQTADVTQTGNSLVKITQVTDKIQHESDPAESAEFNNSAVVKQKGGNDNTIIVNQVADDMINGSGTNSTEAAQDGKKNTMKQTQFSGSYTSGGMVFKAIQKGSENTGTQFSEQTGAKFDLYQDGAKNMGLQKTTGVKTGILVGDIKQVGNSNQGTQLFHGQNVRSAGAVIDQNGDRNVAKQEFDNSSVLWDDPSKADIIQRDKDNYAYQSQVGQGSYQYTKQSGNDNNSKMWSTGDFNEAYSIQAGKNGVVKITQKQDELGEATAGEGNVAMLSQDGNGSQATIMQDGLSNLVTGLNGAGYAVNNNGAMLKVTQTGENNQVWSRQLVGASETVTQTGINNAATVNQY